VWWLLFFKDIQVFFYEKESFVVHYLSKMATEQHPKEAKTIVNIEELFGHFMEKTKSLIP
jgi:hypothetical protein